MAALQSPCCCHPNSSRDDRPDRRAGRASAVGHMPDGVDGEVLIVTVAINQPQRHAGPSLALSPMVLYQPTALAAVGPRALLDSFNRAIPTLLVGHIRGAEKRTPLLSVNLSGLDSRSRWDLWQTAAVLATFASMSKRTPGTKKPTAHDSCRLHFFRADSRPSGHLSCHTHLTAIQSETRARNHCHWA